MPAHPPPSLEDVCVRTAAWFVTAARELPWRSATCTPWGVLVSEVMLQQTPVNRVLPAWVAWMQRWPRPSDLAAAPTSEVLRMWGRLGYPRRALRLQEAARAIAESHGDEVPTDVASLEALPGIGTYTARAIASFGHGQRHPVIDVNVARVLARVLDGAAHGRTTTSKADLSRLAEALPRDAAHAVRASAGLMELGAVICTARAPRCDECLLMSDCTWHALGRPGLDAGSGRTQKWTGTDRQVRGTVMAALRESVVPITIDGLWPDTEQLARCVESLVADGLAVRLPSGELTLPS